MNSYAKDIAGKQTTLTRAIERVGRTTQALTEAIRQFTTFVRKLVERIVQYRRARELSRRQGSREYVAVSSERPAEQNATRMPGD